MYCFKKCPSFQIFPARVYKNAPAFCGKASTFGHTCRAVCATGCRGVSHTPVRCPMECVRAKKSPAFLLWRRRQETYTLILKNYCNQRGSPTCASIKVWSVTEKSAFSASANGILSKEVPVSNTLPEVSPSAFSSNAPPL